MKSPFMRLAVFLLSASLLAAVAPASVEAQPRFQLVQSMPTIGQQSWSPDGWLYQWTASGWARTQLSRTFPNRGNTAVYDIFLNGQPNARVDHSQEGWIHEFHYQTRAQIRYPTNNPAAIQHWIDHASTGGPRGWVTEARQKVELERLVGAMRAQQAQQAQPGVAYPMTDRRREEAKREDAKREEEEEHYRKKREEKFYTDKAQDKKRTQNAFEKKAAEQTAADKRELDRVLNDRAAGEREMQRVLNERAAHKRELDRVLDDGGAQRRANEQAAAARADAARASQQAADAQAHAARASQQAADARAHAARASERNRR